ncbi:hypothetical protein MF672_001055 [Actinomadura sp. ATCC 31491]|uniref:Aminoglycoside phosphotransferase domain-containing protein n=1 Tax=Actinomadura luzonensis TaxID=2805427 RepID=A0ABT0FJA7_9ACTN|nr:hypothetical protein [Actinomadura luzonensis]MCK2212394.1 hypothetical protein [Actinomadura luzonensis]
MTAGTPLRIRVLASSPVTWPGSPTPAELADLLSWRRPPPPAMVGRTCWIPLAEGALKIKGVGLTSRSSAGLRITPPDPVNQFFRTFVHVGFDANGDWRLVDSGPAPMGGCRVSRAMSEYDAAVRLRRKGVPAVLPVGAWEYPDLHFAPTDENLGVAVTLSPHASPWRCDILLRPPDDGPPGRRRVYDKLVREATPSERLASLALEFGARLRGLHEVGLHRYSGGPANWGYDPERDDTYLVDLDSCRPLEQSAEPARALECLRDLASCAFNMAAHAMGNRATFRWRPEELAAGEPFHSLYQGYFPECAPNEIARAVRPFAAYYTDLYLRHVETDASIWMDRRVGYVALIMGALPLYTRVAAGSGELPAPLPVDMVWRAAEPFLGAVGRRRIEGLPGIAETHIASSALTMKR